VNIKKLVTAAILIALACVGANIKIMGSIAFDSMAAFLGALILGPVYGALVGFLGHMISALLSGFPFGLPTHLVIAVSMAITMLGFGFCYRILKDRLSLLYNLIITGVAGLILNGPVSLALCAPLIGVPAAVGLAPVLILASAVNIILAALIFRVYLVYSKGGSK